MDTDHTVDLATVTELADPDDTTYYNVDTVHHNTAGTAVVAQSVFDVLEAAGYISGETIHINGGMYMA